MGLNVLFGPFSLEILISVVFPLILSYPVFTVFLYLLPIKDLRNDLNRLILLSTRKKHLYVQL